MASAGTARDACARRVVPSLPSTLLPPLLASHAISIPLPPVPLPHLPRRPPPKSSPRRPTPPTVLLYTTATVAVADAFSSRPEPRRRDAMPPPNSPPFSSCLPPRLLPNLSSCSMRTVTAASAASMTSLAESHDRRPLHYAVLGAGLAGLSVAWHLLKHSPKDSRVSVDVYDKNGIGAGASGVSGGLLHP